MKYTIKVADNSHPAVQFCKEVKKAEFDMLVLCGTTAGYELILGGLAFTEGILEYDMDTKTAMIFFCVDDWKKEFQEAWRNYLKTPEGKQFID